MRDSCELPCKRVGRLHRSGDHAIRLAFIIRSGLGYGGGMPHSHSSRLQNLAAVLAVLHPSNETGATVLSEE